MRHGSQLDPPNRFEKVHREPDLEHLEWEQEDWDRSIEYMVDSSKSIVSENQSSDIPFRYSINPYRGCVHGCSYCYARNTHEYLGFNAGLDFETKIMFKPNAPALFREFLSREGWQSEVIVFSGVTDCYQPAERKFRLTRDCLDVANEANQPVGVITKNALVVRDQPLIQEMASKGLIHINISLTTLDPELAREMEPRTSIPSARLRAIESLSRAGIPVRVMVAPIIPGLNDHEIPEILKAARQAGALDATHILLRLPLTVEPVFREWLQRTQPLKAAKVESLIRQTRGGQMSQSGWGQRMAGTGEIADQIHSVFSIFQKKLSFPGMPPLNFARFQPPLPRSGQLRLF